MIPEQMIHEVLTYNVLLFASVALLDHTSSAGMYFRIFGLEADASFGGSGHDTENFREHRDLC